MAIPKRAIQMLAKRIHEEVYTRFYSPKATVFLCGSAPEVKGSGREQILAALTHERYSYKYDIFLPEDLFEDLLYGAHHQDLISLEDMLAEAADAVVVVVESYGSAAELGSFASKSNLRKKLVCVIDRRFRRDHSFINYGPLRLLRDRKEGEVLYVDFARMSTEIDSVRRAISRTRKHGTKCMSVTNVLQAHHFLLACLYLLEPIDRQGLIQLVAFASGEDDRRAPALTAGALAILNKRKDVEVVSQGQYRLSSGGLARFSALRRWGESGRALDADAMDRLRVSIMNWQYREKRLVIE